MHVITGCMSSGKTDELIRLLTRRSIAGDEILVVKHPIDVRDGEAIIKSRSGSTMEAVAFDDEDALIDYILEEHGLPNVVAIDEAQFFSRDWIAFVRWCEKAEVALYVTGLNQDFRGEPFGIMPTLMAMADNVTLLDAVCMSCGGRATRTQRLINGEPAHWDEPTVLVGGDESYEPRCVMCHEVPRSTTL